MTTKVLDHNNYQGETWQPTNISSPIVDFRLRGNKEIRRYDATADGGISAVQTFINTYCIPFCIFDGADTSKIIKAFPPAIDWFQCRHEWTVEVKS